MRLINDLIIENNGMLSVIPKGTIISESEQPMDWMKFDKYLVSSLIDNKKIIKDNTKVYEEEVEGIRRDVDDWDMHKALILEGELVFDTFINFEGQFKNMALWIIDDRWEAEELSEAIREESSEILDEFAEELVEENGEWHREDNDDMFILGHELDGDILKLRMKLVFNRSLVNPDPFYKGSYRTGGHYPDA